jgi:hypothetical protein
MRIAALCFALSTLLLCGCGGEISGTEPAGVGANEPDRPIAD